MFDLFDADGGGSIDTAEMTNALYQLGISDSIEEIEKIVAAIDSDGSGEVEFSEFKDIIKQLLGQKDSDEEMQKAFYLFSNGREKIGIPELRRIVTTLNEDVPDSLLHELIKVADKDGDGQINFAEFHGMMHHMVEAEARQMTATMPPPGPPPK